MVCHIWLRWPLLRRSRFNRSLFSFEERLAVQSPDVVLWAVTLLPAIQISSATLVISAIPIKKRFQTVLDMKDLREAREFTFKVRTPTLRRLWRKFSPNICVNLLRAVPFGIRIRAIIRCE